MKYRAEIVISHLARGDPLSEPARAALERLTNQSLVSGNPSLAVADLAVVLRPENLVYIRATLGGRTVEALTSPLEAIGYLDQALLRALMETGLFEEFDIARRTLRIHPADA